MGWLASLLDRLGVCGNAGAIIGALTGGTLMVLDLIQGPLALTDTEAVQIWLIMAVFGWLAILLVFGVFVGWRLRAVAIPALVNSILVTALTLLIARATGLFPWAWLIGILAGMLVGYLLCAISKRLVRA